MMGIVNVTPDSFSDGGSYLDTDKAVAHGKYLADQGALVIDVGGESTRPGSHPVELAEELNRVVPVVERLAADTDVIVSIDTSKPDVARQALEAGAHLVNDVTGLADPDMVAVVADAGVPAVIMHMQGVPATMHLRPSYGDVVEDVAGLLEQRAAQALAAGVPSVMVDPGLGFGKNRAHSVQLLRGLERLTGGPFPVVLGASRKGFIGAVTGESEPAKRDPGSLAAHLFAASKGVALIRTHDVAGHIQGLAMWKELHG